MSVSNRFVAISVWPCQSHLGGGFFGLGWHGCHQLLGLEPVALRLQGVVCPFLRDEDRLVHLPIVQHHACRLCDATCNTRRMTLVLTKSKYKEYTLVLVHSLSSKWHPYKNTTLLPKMSNYAKLTLNKTHTVQTHTAEHWGAQIQGQKSTSSA